MLSQEEVNKIIENLEVYGLAVEGKEQQKYSVISKADLRLLCDDLGKSHVHIAMAANELTNWLNGYSPVYPSVKQVAELREKLTRFLLCDD